MIWSKKGTRIRQKKVQIGPYQPFEVSMCSSTIIKLLFSDLATVKKHSAQSFRKKYLWRRKPSECFRRANVARSF